MSARFHVRSATCKGPKRLHRALETFRISSGVWTRRRGLRQWVLQRFNVSRQTSSASPPSSGSARSPQSMWPSISFSSDQEVECDWRTLVQIC